MAKEELNKTNNEITELARLSDYHYENIFNMFKTGDGFYGFNILKTINFPDDLDPKMYELVEVDRKMSWTNLSFLEYGTIKLWWLICLANGIQNPVQFPSQGMRIKVIKPEFIPHILQQLATDEE
tara:strand:+ start:618 stop:992 length:375 start_codon:yes stop_codon:yes gene_type:complete